MSLSIEYNMTTYVVLYAAFNINIIYVRSADCMIKLSYAFQKERGADIHGFKARQTY